MRMVRWKLGILCGGLRKGTCCGICGWLRVEWTVKKVGGACEEIEKISRGELCVGQRWGELFDCRAVVFGQGLIWRAESGLGGGGELYITVAERY